MSELNSDQTTQAMIRLAHFDPTCRDEYGHQVIDYLVLDSLATFGILSVMAANVKANIHRAFLLDFAEAEIHASGLRLSRAGLIVYSEEKRDERSTFKIIPEINERITSNLLETKKLENDVIQNWKSYLRDEYQEYKTLIENIEGIADNLCLFMSRMFIRHGVECVALLYPDEKKTRDWMASIKQSILDGLPSIDPFTDAIARL